MRDGDVAIKLFDPQGTSDWKALELFEREASALRSLRHQGVPEIFDTTEVDWNGRRLPVLVMEFVDGHSLAQLIDGRTSHGLPEVMRILVDLLGVLEYLHERVPPILHRDIKPANVIVRTNGAPVLVDFGSVRQVFKAADETGSTIAGTYGYMPYEQYMGQATPASDLFSLGATILHLLSGRPPKDFMDGDGRIALPDSISSSAALQRVLARMLKASPQERFTSARQTRDALLAPAVELTVTQTHGQKSAVDQQAAVFVERMPEELLTATPREFDDSTMRDVEKRVVPSIFDYMDPTTKRDGQLPFAGGIGLVLVSLMTLGVYPASFWVIANARRRKVRRFLRDGTPSTARVHRIDSEETAFMQRVARVHYEFEVNGVKHRDSDNVMPLVAGRWEMHQIIPILYIVGRTVESAIVVEM